MAEATKVLTQAEQEIQDKAAAEYATGQVETYKFLDQHIDFNRSPTNVQVLINYMLGKQRAWTRDNLEQSFETLLEAGEFTDPFLPDLVDEVLPQVEPPPEFPWGQTLTTEVLDAMSGRDMAKYLKSPKWGRIFDNQVRTLGLTSKFLKANF
jgi:hypothetical protein